MKETQSMNLWTIVQKNTSPTRKEVMEMKKGEGIGSWMRVILTAMAVMVGSLLFVQVAGAYIITATAGTGGTISPSGNVSVVANTDKTFTIKPNASNCIATLSVDGAQVQPSRTYKFTRVTANHTINATFAADSDNDGISNAQELSGITLAGGTVIPGKNSGFPRADRLDPDTKDLFVVLEQTTPSKFPTNPLEFALKPQSQGGLGFITFHVIPGTQTQGDRFLNSSTAQKAVRVTESSDISNLQVLGSSTCGTPDQDKGTVYTQRIENHVNSVYSPSTPPEGLIATYIKHTIAHELGHMVGPLAPTYNAKYGGYHYQSLPNDLVMNQFVYYTGSGSTATFYIGTSYTSADQGGIKLK